jgi:hypothetical protein
VTPWTSAAAKVVAAGLAVAVMLFTEHAVALSQRGDDRPLETSGPPLTIEATP